MSRILDHQMRISGRPAQGTKNTGRAARASPWIALGLVAMLITAFGAVAAQEPADTTDPLAQYPTDSQAPVVDEPTDLDQNETDTEPVAESTEDSTPIDQEPSSQTSDCKQAGTNAQCNVFGSISMPSQREIKGEPVQIDAVMTIDSVFPEHNARWVLFSLRNITDETDSPVMIAMRSFATEHGPIVTTRVEQKDASELNLWVDTLDLPTHTTITLSATVGSSERGAYTLELLVMAFDRGYTPVKDASGTPQSLYSFTFLGVNKETKDLEVENNSLLDGKKIPSVGFAAGIGLLLALALVVRSRRDP